MPEFAQSVITTIRYDGEALSQHEMDVQDLAPALLALAEMVQLTNRKYNGDDALIRILVKADVEQRCFQVDLHLIQTMLNSAQHLFASDEYKTAKQIAEDLGLVIGGTVSAGGGLFWAWKKLFGTKVEQEKPIQSFETNQRDNITIINNFYGDGNHLEMPTRVYELATNPEMTKLGKKVLKPLEQKGCDKFGLYEHDKPVVEYNDVEAERFIKRAPTQGTDSSRPLDALAVQKVEGAVEIVTAQFQGAAQWRMGWMGKKYLMKIEDEEWLNQYQAGHVRDVIPGARLDVIMEIDMPTSNSEPAFAIKKVRSVIPPPIEDQNALFDMPERIYKQSKFIKNPPAEKTSKRNLLGISRKIDLG